jgi:NRAMP (natural resistance-associated macrophage protein)-like metal ion transporter
MDLLWRRPRRFRRVFTLLAVLGPGLVTMLAGDDAGGIATYAQAGAAFGYEMLWLLGVVTLSLAVVNEMGARMAVVTGKGLADLIRERFGVRSTAGVMLLLLLANLVTTMAEFAGIAAGAELFGVPRWVSVPIMAAVVWVLVTRGSYPVVEKVMLSIGVVYLAYIASGIIAHPPWNEVLHTAVAPHPPLQRDYFLLAIALVGTTVTPWMQFNLQATIAEKGIPEDRLAYSRADVITGAVLADTIAFFIIVATAAVLHGHLDAGQLENMQAVDYARALAPVAGPGAELLFGIGLFGASTLAAGVVPLSTSYTITEAFGWERGVGHRMVDAPAFFGIFTGLIAAGALTILVPGVPLISLILVSQVINGLILSVTLLCMLVLVNDGRVMGTYRNGPIANAIGGATLVLTVGLALLFVLTAVPGSPLAG